MNKQKAKTSKRQYHTKEFKTSAVKMVTDEGIGAAEVASRLGVDVITLRRWITSVEKAKASKNQESMKDLILANKRQEEEIRKLKMEREILKKAMAYLVPTQN